VLDGASDDGVVPHCYVLISTNPRSRDDVLEIADQISEAVGGEPGTAAVYFDDIRTRAHVFVPLESETQVGDVISPLKATSGILDFSVVDARDEAAS
jgi:hypothetical protein